MSWILKTTRSAQGFEPLEQPPFRDLVEDRAILPTGLAQEPRHHGLNRDKPVIVVLGSPVGASAHMDHRVSRCLCVEILLAIRIGLLSCGDFENVIMTNCTLRHPRDSGLKIQKNEGGQIKNMVFSNLTMVNVLVTYGTVGE